jgi:2'-5' RNA ligase
MRLFLGIDLPENVRDAAASISESLERRLGTRVNARWIPAANLHITMWFIGEKADDEAQSLLRAFQRPFNEAAFPIAVAGLGMFPRSGAPRVFWLGLKSGTDRLQRVHAEIADRLRPSGIEPESRLFSPHLTIARVREMRRRERPGALRDELAAIPADAGAFAVEVVTVFRSHLSPKGSSYERLLRVPLQ